MNSKFETKDNSINLKRKCYIQLQKRTKVLTDNLEGLEINSNQGNSSLFETQEEKEDINGLIYLMDKNDVDSKNTTATSFEIYNILSRKCTASTKNYNCLQLNHTHPKISLSGRVLKSDTDLNLIVRSNNENNRHNADNFTRVVPERVSNPLMKNFSEE